MTQFTLSAFADEASPEFDRQIAALHPKKLAILDIYENNAYDIQMELRRTHPEYRIIYVKGEDFTNELITAIQEGNVQAFRNKYRMVDLLLLDDAIPAGAKLC